MIRVVVTLLPAVDGAEPSHIATLDLASVGDQTYRGEARFALHEPPVRVLVERHERRPFGWVPLVRRMLQETERDLIRRGYMTREAAGDAQGPALLYDRVAQPLQSLLLNVDALEARLTSEDASLSLLTSDIKAAVRRLVTILRPAAEECEG